WEKHPTHDNPSASTVGVFVDANAAITPSFTIYSSYSVSSDDLFELGAAGNANSALVVQYDELTSTIENDLVGRIVNADGSMQPSFNMTPWAGNQYRPRVAWDGSQWVVAYNDQKNRFAPLTLDQFDARSDLFGMRVSA